VSDTTQALQDIIFSQVIFHCLARTAGFVGVKSEERTQQKKPELRPKKTTVEPSHLEVPNHQARITT